MSDYIWLLQDPETNLELVFTAQHLAMHAAEKIAEKIVGNNSAAVLDYGDILLYGPEDGTTQVMVRKFTRDDALSMGFDIPIE
jgi:hypothetical protein